MDPTKSKRGRAAAIRISEACCPASFCPEHQSHSCPSGSNEGNAIHQGAGEHPRAGWEGAGPLSEKNGGSQTDWRARDVLSMSRHDRRPDWDAFRFIGFFRRMISLAALFSEREPQSGDSSRELPFPNNGWRHGLGGCGTRWSPERFSPGPVNTRRSRRGRNTRCPV
jgi:hypothetical protein